MILRWKKIATCAPTTTEAKKQRRGIDVLVLNIIPERKLLRVNNASAERLS